MFSNIIYLLATSSLLIGSCMSFYKARSQYISNTNCSNSSNSRFYDTEDYFYLIGTMLFFIKASYCLTNEIYINYKIKTDPLYVSTNTYQRIDSL